LNTRAVLSKWDKNSDSHRTKPARKIQIPAAAVETPT
jgi:hypothetical protein